MAFQNSQSSKKKDKVLDDLVREQIMTFPKKLYVESYDVEAGSKAFVAHTSVKAVPEDAEEVAVYKLVKVHFLKVTKELD